MNRFRTALRRASTVALTFLVATASLLWAPGPVAAGTALPWRFTSVSKSVSLPYPGTGDYYLQCPAGYIPASGGVASGPNTDPGWGKLAVARLLEWPDTSDGTYHITLVNRGYSPVNLVLVANCVWLADVGTITVVNTDLPRHASGYAGDFLYCPAGTTAFNAGMDWSYYSANRSIDYSTPVTGGTQHGIGWYISGYNDHAGATLGFELRCVSSSATATEYAVATDSAAGFGLYAPQASCAPGYRVLTGGIAPPFDQLDGSVDQGFGISGPDSRYYVYVGFGQVVSGLNLRVMSLCVPSSTVSASFTSQPPALSTSRAGSIMFTATDSAGESVSLACYLDAAPKSCASGTAFNYTGLSDGPHLFKVQVQNQYGSTKTIQTNWTIDATAPTIASHSPTSNVPLSGPITITFSEPVTGVSTSSVTVHAETANVDVSGTIDLPTTSTATWTPTTSLASGETYRFSFTSAIQDTVGNALTATYFTVSAATVAPPVVSGHSPATGLSVSGPIAITFSEPVTGVSGSSVTVHAQTANVDVSGTVSTPTTSTATWTPSSSLVPGETYRVSLTSAIHDTDGTALAPTSFDVRASTSVENTSSLFRESWDRDGSSLANGGKYSSSRQSGSKADLAFTATAGQTVALYGIRLSSGGYADIYLDGVKRATASFYAASTKRARVYLSGALTAGSHTISVRPLGTKPSASSSTWVGIDNALTGSTVIQESSFKQSFKRTSSSSASGGSYDTMTHKRDSDANVPKIEVTVVGTGVKVYATKTTSSGSARIYVDGVLKATVSFHASATVYKALVYSGTFALGQHVVRVAAVGTSTGTTSSLGVDRIVGT